MWADLGVLQIGRADAKYSFSKRWSWNKTSWQWHFPQHVSRRYSWNKTSWRGLCLYRLSGIREGEAFFNASALNLLLLVPERAVFGRFSVRTTAVSGDHHSSLSWFSQHSWHLAVLLQRLWPNLLQLKHRTHTGIHTRTHTYTTHKRKPKEGNYSLLIIQQALKLFPLLPCVEGWQVLVAIRTRQGCFIPRPNCGITIEDETGSCDSQIVLTTSLYGHVGTLGFILATNTVPLQVAGEMMPELGPVPPGTVKLIRVFEKVNSCRIFMERKPKPKSSVNLWLYERESESDINCGNVDKKQW